MALIWGVGFFVLGVVMLATVGFLIRQAIDDTPDAVTNSIVMELGLDVEEIDELAVVDPSGAAVSASEIAPLLQDQAASVRTRIITILVLVLPVLAVVAGAAGWWLAGRATRPLVAVTETARQVSSERLDARIRHEGPPDEVYELAEAFDVMMDRLEHAFTAQRQFAAAASHELRTPLTVIRAELDVALDTANPSRDELDEMAEGIRSAIARSEKVIDGLLMLARSGIVDTTTAIDLSQVFDRALDEAAVGIADRDITVRSNISRGAFIRTDPVLIERLVRNLIENAVIHNETGGWIDVDLLQSHDAVTAKITNSGPELDKATVQRLGEPFYRAPTSSGSTPGTGLGVAIVRSIAESHGGQLNLRPRPDGGIAATVELPVRQRR
jgi:signal transduction histidine kinase